jgi:glutamyl-tRNA synthetase
MISQGAEEEIRKAALKNAMDYGKARDSTVVNSVLSKFPELKSSLKELSLAVKTEVERVNGLGKGEIESEASAYKKEFEQKEKEKAMRTAKPRLELEGAVKGAFVTRFPPEPNGYMSIGHAKVSLMERQLADIYSGKIGLYFDDTNPEKEKQEFVDAFKKDLKWIGIDFDDEYYASDNIETLYKYASILIENNNAYVCFCAPEKVKENRSAGTDCEHKSQSPEKNMGLWQDLLNKKLDNGILRLKGDIKNLNTAMRDPTLFRIKTEPHYRQGTKYSVWPTYDFNTSIMDSIKGVTDAIRSKEYELRDELYYTILDMLQLRKPRIHSVARLEIENNVTSKRKLNELMKQGLLSGYDDPRLITIAGLRKRGILPEAIREFVTRFGLSKTDSKVSIDMLLAENRKLIDGMAIRLFFIAKPARLEVNGIPEDKREGKIKMHPTEDLGYRKYKLTDVFFINTYDAINLNKGDLVRLKDAFDIKIEKIEGDSIEAAYTEDGGKEAPKLQWVNEGNYINAKILVIGNLLNGEIFNKNSLETVEGYAEAQAKELKEGDYVQFERIGFFKFDSKDETSFISV